MVVRPSTLRAVLALTAIGLLSACAPFGKTPAPAAKEVLPSSILGSVSFSPPDGTSELDPAAVHVVVKPAVASARLASVTLQPDGADAYPVPLSQGTLDLKEGFRPDHKYTLTAIASVKAKDGTSVDETQVSTFSTATTPKIVGTAPAAVGEGQSVVVTLSPAASAVTVDGPVRGELGPDGTTVTVEPTAFKQGTRFAFTLTAKNLKGIQGDPQPAQFESLPAATAGSYPDSGTSNLGVGVPLTLTLSSPPADRADLVKHLSLTAEVHSPAPAAAPAPNPSPSPSPSPAADPCAVSYNVTPLAGGDLPFNASWTTDRRVRLTPKTPDGYWPADSTIHLAAALTGLKTAAGNSFESDLNNTFKTADKRVIDVDLSTQTLTACRNGVMDNQFPISSGTPTHATDVGRFYIYSRVQDEEMKSPEGPFAPDFYDIKHVPWTQYFDGGAALHGAWWHNNFGHPMSHGCVNVQTPTQNTKYPNAKPQAEYLWNFDYIGDPVIVHGVTPGLTAATQPAD